MARIEDSEVQTLLEGVPAEFRKYKSKWKETYRSKFENVLNQLGDEALFRSLDYLGLDKDDEGVTELDILDKSDKSIFLFTLHRFLNDKKIAVKEFGEKKGDDIGDSEPYTYILEQIISGDTEIVFHIFLFSEWLDEKSKSHYHIKSDLPDDFKSRFEGNSRGIRMTLARNTRAENFDYDSRNRLDFVDSTLFAISRQASDVEKADIQGPQRRRDLRYVFLSITPEESELVISSRSKGIQRELKKKIEDIFSILTVDADVVDDEDNISRTRFEDEFSKFDVDEQEDITILSVEFRDTNIQPSVPISVSKTSVGKEIRPVLSHLGEEIVDIDLLNIKRFYFSCFGVNVKVKIEENIDNSFLRLNSTIYTRSGVKAREIKEKFEAKFGIPLDKKIQLYWITRARRSLLSQMLKGMGYWQTKYLHDEDLIDIVVEEYGVVNRTPLERRKCVGCERIYKQDYSDGCPNCGNDLKKFDTSFELTASKPGIRRYLRQRIEDEGLIYYEKLEEKIYGKPFDFLQIGDGSNVARLLINTTDANITPGTVKYLRKSLHPVLVANPGTVIDETLVEEVTSEVIDLSEMLDENIDDNLPTDYVRSKLDKVLRGTEEQSAAAASDAFEHIQRVLDNPDDYRGEIFEQDAFHILNQIVPTIQQWGAKRRGNQPDGFGELFFRKGGDKYFRSFAFDGKFTSKDELSLTSKEATTLRDYTHRIVKSEEVNTSSTRFYNFIVITNSRPGNFGSVGAAKLNRMRSWSGMPVLMDAGFLLALHIGYNENIESIKANFHLFNEQLFLTLNGGKLHHRSKGEEEYVYLEESDAITLFDALDEEIEGSGLTIEELRKFLETDVMPAD